jgi:hypothetical protein
MIIVKSDIEFKQFLDEPSFNSIVELMHKDCPEFAESVNAKEYEWIGRIMCMAGSDHPGSKIPYGYLFRYQFRKIPIGYDMGISEIRIPESTDEFLDLFNEIKRDPENFNLIYTGK